MSFSWVETRPRIFPIMSFAWRFGSSSWSGVLEKDKNGTPVAIAKVLDEDKLEIQVNKPITLITGDLRIEHEATFGEILHNPREIKINEVPTTVIFERKSVALKKDEKELKEKYRTTGPLVVYR